MKYKLRQNGVVDTEMGISIPDSMDNRRWRQYLAWVADGNIADPEFTAQEISDNTRADKIQELKEEGLIRIQTIMPAIGNFDTLELVREMWLSIAVAARSATVDFQLIIDIYQAARTGVIFLNTATDSAVIAYNVSTDPSWP